MDILVTNDDGALAPGLWRLVEALQDLGEITVVAPDREQSGVGSSISLHHPLHLARLPGEGVPTYTVDGTPVDAVVVALGHLLRKKKVGLIVAGINPGSNLGNDILYSGTIGAALQGYFRGIPSLALSVTSIKEARFDVAAPLARALAPLMLRQRVFRHVLLNVNVPNEPLENIAGVEITRLARRRYADRVKVGNDGRRDYVWIARGTPKWEVEEGTDIWAIRNKRISISPIWTDLTEAAALPQLRRARAAARRALGLPRSSKPSPPESPSLPPKEKETS